MLTKEQVQKKSKKYYEAGKKYGALNDELIKFLGVNIVHAPATPKDDMHNAFEGGLIDHMLKVSKYIVNINECLPKNLKENTDELVKVSLLHQIGKTFLFKKQNDGWRISNLGENYTYNNEIVELKVGERSAYYALKFGIDLSEKEYQAIINYDKEFDKQAKYFSESMTKLLKQANELAIIEEKETHNELG